jgi:nitroreductase
MTLLDLIAAFELPASCRVDQRIPKKLLVENGAPTTADKRNINEGIEEIQWVASLKPSSIGVPEYRDETREYLEIAVLHIALRQDAKAARIAELTHRAVPYPIVLLLTAQEQLSISMAHIRWAQNEAGKVVLDGETISVDLNEPAPLPDIISALLLALSMTRQPRENLKVLYQGWLDSLSAFQAAQITGSFTQSQTDKQAAARQD